VVPIPVIFDITINHPSLFSNFDPSANLQYIAFQSDSRQQIRGPVSDVPDGGVDVWFSFGVRAWGRICVGLEGGGGVGFCCGRICAGVRKKG